MDGIRSTALDTDDELLDEVISLLHAANKPGLWLIFLDEGKRLCQTLIPIDGIPTVPGPGEDASFAPLLDWLADGEGAASVVFVIERHGDARTTAADVAWARCLRTAAGIAELPVRGQIVLHDTGGRWLAPDDYL
ncbi:hypothetical protein [Herbiconiux sp. L3-i23]|uniref:hypothetical protein n=1 Tax=Herbiconiux sp. L3-i23 TaxID=2905871 RepID=UPI002053E746|nr:hypothetical protein [Herbiconiux sp. L3-i23]BDI22455.1 hypothetical protein L3i23_12310 [Herbiconiux sp. L3-i23]